jgi:hypothetical protein
MMAGARIRSIEKKLTPARPKRFTTGGAQVLLAAIECRDGGTQKLN